MAVAGLQSNGMEISFQPCVRFTQQLCTVALASHLGFQQCRLPTSALSSLSICLGSSVLPHVSLSRKSATFHLPLHIGRPHPSFVIIFLTSYCNCPLLCPCPAPDFKLRGHNCTRVHLFIEETLQGVCASALKTKALKK